MASKSGSISRPISISPPPKRRRVVIDLPEDSSEKPAESQYELQKEREVPHNFNPPIPIQANDQSSTPSLRVISSPVQLNFIEELAAPSNVDTISLGGILGNVMIRECWLFNYLFDLDFVM